jgi:hypothetical protein
MEKQNFDSEINKSIEEEKAEYRRCIQEKKLAEAFVHGTFLQTLTNLKGTYDSQKKDIPLCKPDQKPVEIIKEVKTPVEVVKYVPVKVVQTVPAKLDAKTSLIGLGVLYLLTKAAMGK